MDGRNFQLVLDKRLRGVLDERTRKRGIVGVAAVFLRVFLLNSLGKLLIPTGSSYSALHGAIRLKLPSMAILP